MSLELVVARYNESLDWLSLVDSKYKITVYNKGDGNFGIKLPNVGREAHTYLTHIIDNYDNLAETTIFCQGNPFDHEPHFLEKINLLKNTLPELPDFFAFGKILNTEAKISTHPNWKFGPLNINMFVFTKNLYQNIYDVTYEKQNSLQFIGGAQFLVKKNKVFKYEKDFYINAKKLVDYDANPVEAHCFERSWHYIFS